MQYSFLHYILNSPCGSGSVLCIGSEWHRFPSSFFIPDYVGQVRWLDDGFTGLLPIPFNSSLGGTSAAPSYFNNKNKASEEQYVSGQFLLCLTRNNVHLLQFGILASLYFVSIVVYNLYQLEDDTQLCLVIILQLTDPEQCTFLIELQLQRPYPTRGSDLSTWEVLAHPRKLITLLPCCMLLTCKTVACRLLQHFHIWTGSYLLHCTGRSLFHITGSRRMSLASTDYLGEYQSDCRCTS